MAAVIVLSAIHLVSRPDTAAALVPGRANR
jgi:hypothetical protein